MGLGDALGKLNVARQIQKEIKEPGFSFKVMSAKAAKAVGWYLLGLVGLALAAALMDTEGIKAALHNAGLSDAIAVALSGGMLWIGKSILNALANMKQKDSPVDGQPVNVQAAEKSGPVLTTEAQMVEFMRKYNALRNDGVGFEDARKLALSFVTGLPIQE